MEDFRQGTFKPVLSEIVAAEIAPAPEQVRAQYAELLTLPPRFAALTDEVHLLSAAYEARQILPQKCANDALHIALATVAEVDILVSWNFKHLVRFERRRAATTRIPSYSLSAFELGRSLLHKSLSRLPKIFRQVQAQAAGVIAALVFHAAGEPT